MKKLFTILVFAIITCSFIKAQDIITDRPDQAEAAFIVPVNSLQIEAGTLLEIDNSHNNWTMLTSLFRYGYNSNLEFRLETGITREQVRFNGSQEIGINDLALGFKYKLNSRNADWALLGHINFPNGSENVTDNRYSALAMILHENDLADRVGYAINAGFRYYNTDFIIFKYAAAIGFDLNTKTSFYAEFFGENSNQEDEEFEHFFDCGFAYLVNPLLQLDFALGTGITDKYNFYTLGISYRIDN